MLTWIESEFNQILHEIQCVVSDCKQFREYQPLNLNQQHSGTTYMCNTQVHTPHPHSRCIPRPVCTLVLCVLCSVHRAPHTSDLFQIIRPDSSMISSSVISVVPSNLSSSVSTCSSSSKTMLLVESSFSSLSSLWWWCLW